MSDFIFQTCHQIVNRAGAIASLGELCRQLGITRPLVVTDPGIEQAGLLLRALDPLQRADMTFSVFTDVVADPPEATVREAVEYAMAQGSDGVIGFGGGSAMDTAKLVALLGRSREGLNDVYGVDQAAGPRYPLILVPTTAGTGSEVTPIAIVTTEDDTKVGVVTQHLLADIALLDAELTLGLPPAITTSTAIDAMVHAIEAYTSKLKKNSYSDMLARQALSLLSVNLDTVICEPHNLKARQALLLGAMMAGQAFANAPVAAVHALAYPLGGQFHVSHGLSNSLVMTPVMQFNRSVAAPLYAELAPCIMGDDAPRGVTVCEAANLLIENIQALIERTGLPTRLQEVGVSEAALTGLAEDAMQQQRLLINNPREVGFEDALAIYRSVL